MKTLSTLWEGHCTKKSLGPYQKRLWGLFYEAHFSYDPE